MITLAFTKYQIRSYALDRGYVKDLRTNVEGAPERVLDGDIDKFVKAALLLRVDRHRWAPDPGMEELRSAFVADARGDN